MDINTMLFNVAYAMANDNNKKSKEEKKALTKVFFKLESGGVGCEIAISARVGSDGIRSGVVLDLVSGRKLFVVTNDCRMVIREVYNRSELDLSGSTQISCTYLDT